MGMSIMVTGVKTNSNMGLSSILMVEDTWVTGNMISLMDPVSKFGKTAVPSKAHSTKV